MLKHQRRIFLFVVISLVATLQSFSQLSKIHYIPPLTSAEFGNANPEDQYIYISTPKTHDVIFTITPKGGTAFTGFVSNTTPYVHHIGFGDGQLFIPSNRTGTVINNAGYIIEAEDVIYASVRMEAGGAQAGALVSKGIAALGNSFRVGAYTNEVGYNGNDPTNTNGLSFLSFVSVMATEDDTEVVFSDISNTASPKNFTGTFPFNITLNEGESCIIAMNSYDASSPTENKDGLIGALVESDKPIVVNCGSANGSFHNGGARDYGIDQIVGADKIGTEYILVKGDGQNDWENVLIVANEDNTSIYINGNTTAVANKNAGEYYLIEGDEYNASGNMYVQTSNPVFTYQGIGSGTGEANQGMFFVPPLSCNNRGNVNNIAEIDKIGAEPYIGGVTIVTNKGASVTINNQPLSNFSTTGPFNVDGNPNYETYKIVGLSGNVSVECDQELYCAYFNINGAASSGSFYSGFPSAPEINFDATFQTLGNCIDNITLSAANTENFDTFEWYFDDGTGSGFQPSGFKTPDLTPTIPGKYKLIGIITCSGLTLESIEVPVSICPDDIDDDGIIDNLDIDNDNDGILNCTESKGNVTLNLLNSNQPELIFQDGTTDASIANGLFTQNNSSGTSLNTLSGTTTGVFTSTVQPASDAESEYKISFTEFVNIKFTEESSTIHTIIDGETFIAKISPANKNITLLDPDNRLLIDANYDGLYDDNPVQEISGSEIHFKINPNPSGSNPYKFLANNIEGFSFIHKLSNTTDSSQFVGEIELTCFSEDTDNDGFQDALDYDSDNDGIPDYIEVNGMNNILLDMDADLNGFDDVFNLTATPKDTDNDGVYDFLDLDSDNDGIYDLFETGQLGLLLSDTNFDGIIDLLDPSETNGWDDNAESAPDSGTIGYPLDDLDTDLEFSYYDSDSDGDTCSDVIEAGFSDGNNDNYIDGTGIDSNGLVTGSDGYYTVPNANYNTIGLITIIDQPTAQIGCYLETTIFEINTNTVDSSQWELSVDAGVNWTSITDNTIYSGATTNKLTIVNTPLTYNNYQYRVLMKKTGNSCNSYSNEVLLTVNPLPIANAVSDLELCDDLDDGDDTNGFVQSFDLESQTTTILGATQLPQDYTVTYHLNSADAISGSLPQLSPFENTVAHTQTIYVSVENNTTGCRISNTSFNLIVNALPIANAVSDIELCDDLDDGNDTNGFVQSFDLESQTTTILGATQLPVNYTVSYHLNPTDAISGTAPQTSLFTNTVADTQTIYVRVLNNATGCVNPHLTFNVIVNPLPIANAVLDLELCDNLDDGNDTNGFVQSFDLKSQTATILGATQSASDYTVTYHLNQGDAISGNAPQTSPFTNTTLNSQTIYVRILNAITGCVNPHLTFNVIVHPLPIITTPVFLTQCDNDTDGFSPFNLTEVNAEISTDYLNETITFHETQAEAIAGVPEITNPTSYTNQINSDDIVWARVESTFGCSRISEIQLHVSTTGIPASFQRTFNICDDYLDPANDNRDGISTFDFSSVDTDVRSIFPVGQLLTIKYFRNEADALAEADEITDISNYRNIGYPNSQQIYIRVDSQIDNDCLGFGDYITLNVEALPTAYPLSIARQCDDDQDGMYPFDVASIESTVLNNQTNVTVSYFDEIGIPLPSPLPNPFITASQTITIRVTNNATADPNGACFDETTLQFTVDKSPIANPITIAPVCDDVSNDGFYDFDTSTIQSTILGSNQPGMEVHYFDQSRNELDSPLPNPFTTSTQTITAQVINPINTTCTASTTLNFIVNPLPNFEVETPQTLCITDPQEFITLDVVQENYAEALDYEWRHKNDLSTVLGNNTTLDVYEDGVYEVTLIKTDGTGCSRTREIEVVYSEIAKISLDDITIEDDADVNTIAINNENNNLGLGDYEFSLDDDFSGFQDDPFFNNVTPGFHTIYIRDKNGCNTAEIDVSVIGYPKFFTPNNDGENDTWNVLGVNENFYSNSNIYIFDRFGKLIIQIDPKGEGWDGLYKGDHIPSTDYWFSVELIDSKGNVKVRKGHFSLIRR